MNRFFSNKLILNYLEKTDQADEIVQFQLEQNENQRARFESINGTIVDIKCTHRFPVLPFSWSKNADLMFHCPC